MSKKDKWVKRWKVPSSSSDKEYTVAIDTEDNYGCSCPRWKFHREQCHHIEQVKVGGGEESKLKPPPEIRFAKVLEVTLDKKNNIAKVPLRAVGDSEMAATIVYDLMCLGHSHTSLKTQFDICKRNTRETIIWHVLENGRTIYGDYPNMMGQQPRICVEVEKKLKP